MRVFPNFYYLIPLLERLNCNRICLERDGEGQTDTDRDRLTDRETDRQNLTVSSSFSSILDLLHPFKLKKKYLFIILLLLLLCQYISAKRVRI